MSLQAVVLAGGLGTRLRAAVGEVPKVLAPVAGRPFLEHVLADLDRQGFERVVLAVGWRRELVRGHFGDRFRGLSVAYSEEIEPLGTGGAVRQAVALAGPGPCFALNGDTWLDLDYPAMLAAHRAAGARVSMAVREVPDVGRFGALDLAGGRVTRFREKGGTGPGFINAGVYLLEAGVFEGLGLPAAFSIEKDLLQPQLAALAPLAWVASGRFIDIGVPDDYRAAQDLLAEPRA
ncbi:MAG: nucleotidyltransferase family protein [Anaeromyxobacter sp.]